METTDDQKKKFRDKIAKRILEICGGKSAVSQKGKVYQNQTVLAQRVGVTQSYINNIVLGRTGDGLERIGKLIEGLRGEIIWKSLPGSSETPSTVAPPVTPMSASPVSAQDSLFSVPVYENYFPDSDKSTCDIKSFPLSSHFINAQAGSTLIAVKVNDSAMEPVFTAGDIAIIDTSDRSIKNGNLMLVMTNTSASAVIRRVSGRFENGKYVLCMYPENRKVEPAIMAMSPNFDIKQIILGKVINCWRDMENV